MAETLGFGDHTSCKRTSRPAHRDGFRLRGHCRVVCSDSTGEVKWVDQGENIVTDEGIDYMMGTAPIDNTTTLYLGLLTASPSPAAGWTMPTFASEAAGYVAGSRPSWTQGAVASKVVTNSTAVTFTMNGDDTSIGGAFITTSLTKDGTSGTLIAARAFTGGNKTVATDDTLDVTYTITGADSGA